MRTIVLAALILALPGCGGGGCSPPTTISARWSLVLPEASGQYHWRCSSEVGHLLLDPLYAGRSDGWMVVAHELIHALGYFDNHHLEDDLCIFSGSANLPWYGEPCEWERAVVRADQRTYTIQCEDWRLHEIVTEAAAFWNGVAERPMFTVLDPTP